MPKKKKKKPEVKEKINKTKMNTEKLDIRCSSSDKNRWRRKADAAGMSLSSWVRHRLDMRVR